MRQNNSAGSVNKKESISFHANNQDKGVRSENERQKKIKFRGKLNKHHDKPVIRDDIFNCL